MVASVLICNKTSQQRHNATRAHFSTSRGSPAHHQLATTSHQAHQLATTTASGSAIRKNTSHHQGQHRAHPAPLRQHRAAGPQKGQEGPPTVSPRERHRPPRQQPTEGEQGAMGGSCPARVRDTPPQDATQKWELGLVAKKTKGGGRRVSQVGLCVLGFRSLTSREIRVGDRRGCGEKGCSAPVYGKVLNWEGKTRCPH